MKKGSLLVTAILTAAVLNAGEKTASTQAEKAAKKAPAKRHTVRLTPEMLQQLQRQMQRQAKPIDWSFLPETVAEINGKKITRQELIKWAKSKLPPRVTTAQVKRYAYNLVNGLVSEKLLLNLAAKAGFKPSKELAAKVLQGNVERLKVFNPEMLKSQQEMLKQQGKTLADMINARAANPNMQLQAAILEWARSMNKVKKPSDKEIKEFYDKNKDNPAINRLLQLKIGDPAGSMRASHILFLVNKKQDDKTAKAKAEAVLAQLKKGADFAELARKNSEGPSRIRGGSLGAFQKGQMVKPFEDAVLKLKPGQISGLVRTRFGYHIIRRDKSVKTQYVPYDDKLKNKIAQYIMMREEGKVLPKFIRGELEKAKAAQKVKIFVKDNRPKPAAKPTAAKK